MDIPEALVKIDGKPIEKLIEVVSKGIGTLYRPRQIRKEADAQAYAIKVVGHAQAEADAEKRLIEIETEDRICRRIAAKEIRRQENIDSIVELAANNLEGETVSDKPVDEDWAARFFEIAQDISREDMKMIWARILAKEVEEPSSFSLRTLEVLRNISSEEARIFEKVANYVFCQGECFVYNDSNELDKLGIHYVDLALLTECGLLQAGDFVSKHYKSQSDTTVSSGIIYGKYVMLMTLPMNSPTVDIPVILLTKAGQDLFELIEPKSDLEYMKVLAKAIKKKNAAATVQYSEWILKDNDVVKYKTPLIDL